MSSYVAFTGDLKERRCSSCLEDLTNGKPVVNHTGEGSKHPIHKECIQKWINSGGRACPDCRTKINSNSVLYWKDRVVTEIKLFTKDVIEGVEIGFRVCAAPLFSLSFYKISALFSICTGIIGAGLMARDLSQQEMEKKLSGYTALIITGIGAKFLSIHPLSLGILAAYGSGTTKSILGLMKRLNIF